MIVCVSLLCNILAILILMHNLLSKKLVIDGKMIALLLLDVCIFYLINCNALPRIMQLVIYVFLFLYFKAEFNDKSLWNRIGAFLCTYFIVCGIEILIYCIIGAFEIDEAYDPITNLIVLACVIILVRLFDIGKLYQFIKNAKYSIALIVFGCGFVYILLMVIVKLIRRFSFLEVILGIAIFLIVTICLYQWKTQRDIIMMKEREIKWLEQCNASFDQLIADVRSRQHEFNNEIDTICGMQYSCETYDELVQQINTYTEKVLQENQFNKLLTMECPPIIKGFLYYRFHKASMEEIIVDYHIALDCDMDFPVIFDIAEIVGILFDNACEAIKKQKTQKQILVCIKGIDAGVQIMVENASSYVSYQEISRFTKKGYSTKGTARGYGLYNVRKLVDKYKGEIAIQNAEKTGENWLQIMVELSV